MDVEFIGKYHNFPFPSQRVSDKEKEKPEWYAAACDWVIAQGQAYREQEDIDEKYGILQGNVPDAYYRKTLNPYNTTKDKYKRFPATLRNYDMLKGIIRRYVSEYIKNPHDFIVSAVNPEVVLARNAKLNQELMLIVEQKIAAKIQETYQEYLNGGGNPQEFNPQQALDVEAFIKEFNEKYIDDVSQQGQDILNVIQTITDDILLYARAYFDFVTFGECYTYSEVVGSKLIKKNVQVRDAFPVPNDNMFVEDFDMFAERIKMSYQQIIDTYGEYLDDKQIEFLNTYYNRYNNNFTPSYAFSVYDSYFPDVCGKFTNEERELFGTNNIMARDSNHDLYDVWRAVWRGEQKRAIVTYVNEVNLITQRIETGDYELDKSKGDIDIEYVYEPQVYESIRIGTRNDAIYPFKARAIPYNRGGKLPYNGLCELIPGLGKFSIIELVTPFQVFYNIVAYHREMAIAKNKLSILLIAKSLLGTVPEDTIYKMLADGVLYIDDESDMNMIKSQQIRMVNADISSYIVSITNLLDNIEQKAKEQVDMTPQRYGAIANSAGKGVTEEAIIRGSMGSVIIEFIMDYMRQKDYARDMDYSKFAWIDGLDTSIKDSDDRFKYISLDIDKHAYADYIVQAKNSAKEMDKLEQLKAYAFSAAQNGNDEIAIAAIMGDNVATIKNLITNFKDIERKHEENLKQLDIELENLKQENELNKIRVKAEEDRKTKELQAIIDKEIAIIQGDANLLSYDNSATEVQKQAAANRLAQSRERVDKEKINLAKQQSILEAYNREQDRNLKREEFASKEKIAKENKNRYDFKSKK